jgi:hypothetical protein
MEAPKRSRRGEAGRTGSGGQTKASQGRWGPASTITAVARRLRSGRSRRARGLRADEPAAAQSPARNQARAYRAAGVDELAFGFVGQIRRTRSLFLAALGI